MHHLKVFEKKHSIIIFEAINNNKISNVHDLNQDTNLTRSRHRRWSSHYDTLVRLVVMFSSVIEVLEMITEEGIRSYQKYEAIILLNSIHSLIKLNLFFFVCI